MLARDSTNALITPPNALPSNPIANIIIVLFLYLATYVFDTTSVSVVPSMYCMPFSSSASFIASKSSCSV